MLPGAVRSGVLVEPSMLEKDRVAEKLFCTSDSNMFSIFANKLKGLK